MIADRVADEGNLSLLLVGPDQKWLTTAGFLDKIDANLKAAMAAA